MRWEIPEPVFAWNITSYSPAGLFDRLRTMIVHLDSGRLPVGYSDGHLAIEEVSSGKRESIGAESLTGDDYGVSADGDLLAQRQVTQQKIGIQISGFLSHDKTLILLTTSRVFRRVTTRSI